MRKSTQTAPTAPITPTKPTKPTTPTTPTIPITTTIPTPQSPMRDGIYLNGTCVGRTRRMVGENGSKELITYKIQTRDNMFYVKDWEANGNYFSIGEIIEIPLKIQPYTSKGTTRVDFTYLHPRDMEF